MTDIVVVLITASSPEEGQAIAKAIVDEHLAACVNVLTGVQSCFYWEGRTQQASECLLVCKARSALLDRLIDRVKELHSYTVPEIIALPVIGGLPAYLEWVRQSSAGQ